ncbi:hypothetical protein PAPYR_1366 [Paratrimastix pyriformis]|uniref:Nucleolus and neural progenitor protein-like N-terminal domain-containing protein n=1 Tax=Paratrimastix pyriformis TaxID=342808 RepID=A0ABQ8UVN7_9EUKA|nr:hypothetical protein PAPYR_1366 [Paratrimastix pyriformis]
MDFSLLIRHSEQLVMESRILDRLLYRNKNQMRQSIHFHKLVEVKRKLGRLPLGAAIDLLSHWEAVSKEPLQLTQALTTLRLFRISLFQLISAIEGASLAVGQAIALTYLLHFSTLMYSMLSRLHVICQHDLLPQLNKTLHTLEIHAKPQPSGPTPWLPAVGYIALPLIPPPPLSSSSPLWEPPASLFAPHRLLKRQRTRPSPVQAEEMAEALPFVVDASGGHVSEDEEATPVSSISPPPQLPPAPELPALALAPSPQPADFALTAGHPECVPAQEEEEDEEDEAPRGLFSRARVLPQSSGESSPIPPCAPLAPVLSPVQEYVHVVYDETESGNVQ